jgi:hypothetical protein
MFKTWKQAWKDAVENFRRELDPERYDARHGQPAPEDRAAAMRRDLESAQSARRRLEADLDDARQNLAREREEEERCRRRAALARQIEDDETARIALEYAARHAERAAVLQQKLAALTAERDLLQRDLDVMQAALAEFAPPGPSTGAHLGEESDHHAAGSNSSPRPPPDSSLDDEVETNEDDAFQRLEREARERAAEARLEELKRKLR